ncbi:MAG: Fic family protein [Deltaproteobacteria bacterium]|nr:Fic family protein [Deltaproteobacteria bacterium]
MATPKEKLAASMTQLQNLQKGGRRVFRSKELTRVHRERLLQHGFIREVMKGWLISSNPGADPGDTTPWFSSFWEFCARYCHERFGHEWRLSPEQSLLLHAENRVIPKQVIIFSTKGANNTLDLPFGMSLYDLKQKQMPPEADLTVKEGLILFSAEAALIRVSEAFFVRSPLEAQVVLSGIRDVSHVLGRLLDGGHSAIAGRLAGAFRRIDRADFANEILAAMKAAGYDVREKDPFMPQQTLAEVNSFAAPIVGRIQAMWESFRRTVIEVFPAPPGLPKDREAYLRFIDEIYRSDAYHSLSIEGYRVSPNLIERVRSGAWDPENLNEDRDSRDAMAARGYWQAFQLVKGAVAEIIGGGNPGALARTAHRDWYRELFQPCVATGLIPPSALAGYRNDAVFLQGSRHVPPRREAVGEAMSSLFNLLEEESEPSVRAVLAHWLFGYIHPYLDGNGRMARFLMNAMLASGGYPWTVISVDDRNGYLTALESASIDLDIKPFTMFVAERVERSLYHKEASRKL